MALEKRCMTTDMNIPHRDETESNKLNFLHIPAGRWGQPVDRGGALIFFPSKVFTFISRYIPTDQWRYFGADPNSSSANRKVKTIHRF